MYVIDKRIAGYFYTRKKKQSFLGGILAWGHMRIVNLDLSRRKNVMIRQCNRFQTGNACGIINQFSHAIFAVRTAGVYNKANVVKAVIRIPDENA